MAATCERFEALFETASTRENQNEITIVRFGHIDGPMLKKMIDYCYSGQIEISVENITNVMTTASYLEISPLVEQCKDFLQLSLTVDNCVQMLLDGERYGITICWKKSLDFICRFFEQIPIEHILNIDDYQIVFAVLNAKELTAPESYIFDVMQKWVMHHGTQTIC